MVLFHSLLADQTPLSAQMILLQDRIHGAAAVGTNADQLAMLWESIVAPEFARQIQIQVAVIHAVQILASIHVR